SLKILRVSALLGPAALVLLAPAIARRIGDRGRLFVPTSSAAAILVIPMMVAGVVAGRQIRLQTACLGIGGTHAPDLTAAPSLRGRSGRVWTTFDWGEYGIWHFGPALRVSIDGRRETIYSDAVLEWLRAAENGNAAALDKMLALAPEYAWLPAMRTIARAALVSHGYRIDVETRA